MNQTDRMVRARVYELFVAGHRDIDAALIGIEGADEALSRLEAKHRLKLTADGKVHMAHPFSGVDTGHTATVGGRVYWSNCAWDALALLSQLGDGVARCPDGPEWTVTDGVVSPKGFVHLLVPAAHFWDDVVFTWSNIRGFRSEADIDRDEGVIVTAQAMYDLSKDWYRDRFSADWQPPTGEQATAIFGGHGLTGEFWNLASY